jgi:6-pyruvoyltetrahydropterin/6-carboxytetrahydropterin synthase
LLVTVEGNVRSDGMVLDFVILKKMIMEHVIDRLDHYHLNDIIPGNSSAENIAIWIWNELSKAMASSSEIPDGVNLYEIRVWETEDSSVIYRGE